MANKQGKNFMGIVIFERKQIQGSKKIGRSSAKLLFCCKILTLSAGKDEYLVLLGRFLYSGACRAPRQASRWHCSKKHGTKGLIACKIESKRVVLIEEQGKVLLRFL